MDSRLFGTLPSGEAVEVVTLANAGGASAQILTLGGALRALAVPDRDGRPGDVVLGFDQLESYLAPRLCMGSIVGRIAGRVTGGLICIDGVARSLACNDGRNHLHGGATGLDRRRWRIDWLGRETNGESVRLRYHSPEGEEGYPGTLDIAATYTLTDDHCLVFETSVATDRPTPVSLAQHAYFNLSAERGEPILDHIVQVNAKEYVPVDASLTLQDRREPVHGTGADLNRPKRIGDALAGFEKGHGDHYLLDGTPGIPVATVLEPGSGRRLQLFTDHTSLQLYTGYAIGGTGPGKSGKPYGPYSGLCLECEGYPNGSTVPSLGDILVQPGLPQRRRTTFAFSTF